MAWPTICLSWTGKPLLSGSSRRNWQASTQSYRRRSAAPFSHRADMTVFEAAPLASVAPRDPAERFGHPKGLFYLAFSEAWERFSAIEAIAALPL